MDLKEKIAKKVLLLLSKKNFAEWFLYTTLALAIISQTAAILMILYYNTYGNTDIMKYATELTYSTVATCSIGLGGYFCFKSIKLEKK